MADFTDVADALAIRLGLAFYPNGINAPSRVQNAVKVYHGWPDPRTLDLDLIAGTVHVNVWPTSNEDLRNTHSGDWEVLSIQEITLEATTTDNSFTLSGDPKTGLNIAVVFNNEHYVHGMTTTETAEAVAEILLQKIIVDFPTAARVGTTVTVPGARNLSTAIGSSGIITRELERRERLYHICVWANTNELRNAAAKVVEGNLGGAYRLEINDGTTAIVRYRNSAQRDDMQKDNMYRRDIMYNVSYSFTEIQPATQIVTTKLDQKTIDNVDIYVKVN